MPPISLRKIVFWIMVIIMLSQLDHIIAFILSICRILNLFISGVFWIFYNSFEPLRKCSDGAKYVVALLFLALVWATIFKIFSRK